MIKLSLTDRIVTGLSSIAERFKVPFFGLTKVRAAASKYSPVKFLYVSSPESFYPLQSVCYLP